MITGGKLSLVAFLFFEYNVWKVTIQQVEAFTAKTVEK